MRKSHEKILKEKFQSIKRKYIAWDSLIIVTFTGEKYILFLHNVTLKGNSLDLGPANMQLALEDIKGFRIIVKN